MLFKNIQLNVEQSTFLNETDKTLARDRVRIKRTKLTENNKLCNKRDKIFQPSQSETLFLLLKTFFRDF